MNIPIKGIIEEETLKAREERDPPTSWHASGLGSCLRGQYFKRKGVEPDEEFDARTLSTFELGNMVEEMTLKKLRKSPKVEVIEDTETAKKIIKEQRGNLDNLKIKTRDSSAGPQIYVRDTKNKVSGMIDGFLRDNKGVELLEVKSRHSRAFHWMRKRGGPNEHHKMQLWWYLAITRTETGNLLYVSKSDQCMLNYIVAMRDKELRNKVVATVELLNKAWKEKDPSILPLPDKKWKKKYCSYHSHCLKVGDDKE